MASQKDGHGQQLTAHHVQVELLVAARPIVVVLVEVVVLAPAKLTPDGRGGQHDEGHSAWSGWWYWYLQRLVAYPVLAGVQYTRQDKLPYCGVICPVLTVDPVKHDLLAGLLGQCHPEAQ